MRGGKVTVQIERVIDIVLGRIDAAFLEGDGGPRIVSRGAAAPAGQHAVDLGARRLVGALVGQDERTHQRNIGCIGLQIAGRIEVAQGALGVAVGTPHNGAAVHQLPGVAVLLDRLVEVGQRLIPVAEVVLRSGRGTRTRGQNRASAPSPW